MKFCGVYTALVTPFTKSGKVDYTALNKLLEKQINAGVSGVVLLSTTGEESSLSLGEKLQILRFARQKVGKKLQFLIGLGAKSTESALFEAETFKVFNPDAFVVSPPAFVKPTERGLYCHFKKIADSACAPIILYDVPSRSACDFPLKVIEKLSLHKNIVGIKEASGNFCHCVSVCALHREDFAVFSGNDNLTLPMLSVGAVGVVSVLSNAFPENVKAMIDCWIEEKVQNSLEIHEKILKNAQNCFIETNPVPIKYMLKVMGLAESRVRLPLSPLKRGNRKKVEEGVSEILFDKTI